MSHNFVLVHSPLIGPTSWRPVADVLAGSGHPVAVPSLLPALGHTDGFAEAIARLVANHLEASDVADPLLLVAHSAAGAFLPVIAAGLAREVSGYVFVDARLPMNGKSLWEQDPPEAQKRLRSLARDGRLPPWSEWFGPDVMARAVPDADLRVKFIEELRPIPLALFEEPIHFSQAWPDGPCAYLRLSEAYAAQAEEARAAGWPVIERGVGHLYPTTHPGEMVGLLMAAVAALERPK